MDLRAKPQTAVMSCALKWCILVWNFFSFWYLEAWYEMRQKIHRQHAYLYQPLLSHPEFWNPAQLSSCCCSSKHQQDYNHQIAQRHWSRNRLRHYVFLHFVPAKMTFDVSWNLVKSLTADHINTMEWWSHSSKVSWPDNSFRHIVFFWTLLKCKHSYYCFNNIILP